MFISFRSLTSSFFYQLLTIYGFCICVSLSASDIERPNVLILSIDDLRPELGCYGASHMVTPHIDALAQSATLFKSAYVQQAVCLPSRISLFTGMRPDSTGVHDLTTKFRQTIPDAITIPQHFGSQGYETIGMGKVYHDEQLKEWSQWIDTHNLAGVNFYQAPATIARIEVLKNEARVKGLKGKSLRQYVKGPAYESFDAPDNAYLDGAMTDLAINALQQSRDVPFFMVVGFKKPHLPFVAPKKYWDLYDYERITLPDNYFPPTGAPSIAQMAWGELRAYAGIPSEGPVSDEVGRKLTHGYYASVSFIDAQVGRLMATLDEVGLTENTIVVLWGDHGWKLGEHAMWCKHTNYEIDAHVPFLIKAPGKEFQSGSTDALVELLDLYPTLCDLAQLPTPAQCEGSSLLSLLRDPSAEWNELAYTQYPRSGWVMGYSVKSPSGRYTEWIKRGTGKVVDREYYDHQLDPSENLNRAGEADYAGVIDSLSKAIAEERKRCEK